MTPFPIKRGSEFNQPTTSFIDHIVSALEERNRAFNEACAEYLVKAREYDNDPDVGGAR